LAVGVVLGGLGLSACKYDFGFYRGSTTQGHETFRLWQGFVWAGIAVGGLTFLLILWSVFRYRRKGDTIPKQITHNLPLEIIYTITPILIVAVLFGFTVVTEDKVDYVSPDPAVKVLVTAYQWGWDFHYTGTNVTVSTSGAAFPANIPEPVLPVGQTVEVTLVSNDVIHGFYVAKFDFSRYAQPGVVNKFDLNIRQPGVYLGRCTQLCGLYHDQMLFRIHAVSPSQYQAWLTSQESSSVASKVKVAS
jgi:cytochrome c oxidase subunit 2